LSIIFLTQESHRFTHQALTGPFSKVDVRVRDYQWLLNKSRLPKGCYVFTDRERMAPWELRVYAEIYRHINRSGPAYRAINDPARMLNRYALLRALHEGHGLGLADLARRFDRSVGNFLFRGTLIGQGVDQ
jgi:hypothetical protein